MRLSVATQLLTLCLTTAPVHAFRPAVVNNLSSFKRAMSSGSDVGLSNIGIGQQAPSGGSDGDGGALISWKSRIDASIAKSRKTRGSNYVQISTVADGEPRCRTVVFRGFQKLPSDHPIAVTCDDSSCVMKMITDNRSNKVSETSSNSAVEMVWWFPKTSEQYRVRGTLMFVGGGEFALDNDKVLATARKEQWGNLRDQAREQFYWEEPSIDYTGESKVPEGGRDAEGSLMSAPDTFLLMFLLPSRIDYLRLGDNFRQIDEFSDAEWKRKRVNP